VYQSHLFLHPSRTTPDGNREGVPNSLLEAMASGAPVIATRHGGIPEAVSDGESGLLVDESDSQALAASALSLMTAPTRMQQMADHARRRIETAFNREANIKTLEGEYLRLMNRVTL
jgi:colanic acid/amylovoran biosynthesis glycosyltransferase